MKPVERTLELLKKMFENGPRFIMGRYGESGLSTCDFNSPLTISEIERTLSKNSYFLPEDYKHFLSIHNGCKLFRTESDTKIEIFTLQEALELSEEQQSDDGILEEYNYWIIGQVNEYWILIDKNQCKEPEGLFTKAYITMFHPSDGLETAYVLNLNFECFLECAVISQGDNFWTWENDSVLYEEFSKYKDVEVEI